MGKNLCEPRITLLTVLVVMSLVAGVAKVMQMLQELEFLFHIGVGTGAVITLGIIQCAGGLLLVMPGIRVLGAVLVVIALAVSCPALFTAGNGAIGLITLFPIAIGVSVITDRGTGN